MEIECARLCSLTFFSDCTAERSIRSRNPCVRDRSSWFFFFCYITRPPFAPYLHYILKKKKNEKTLKKYLRVHMPAWAKALFLAAKRIDFEIRQQPLGGGDARVIVLFRIRTQTF